MINHVVLQFALGLIFASIHRQYLAFEFQVITTTYSPAALMERFAFPSCTDCFLNVNTSTMKMLVRNYLFLGSKFYSSSLHLQYNFQLAGCIILEDYLASEVDLEKKDRYITSLREKVSVKCPLKNTFIQPLTKVHPNTISWTKQRLNRRSSLVPWKKCTKKL